MEAASKKIPLSVVPKLPDVDTCPLCHNPVQRDEEHKRISCYHCGIIVDSEVNAMHAITNRWNALPRQKKSAAEVLSTIAIAIVLAFFFWRILIKTEIIHETKSGGFCITKNYCLS